MKFEYWQSLTNQNWYWHLRAANGQIIANGEGYVDKVDCLRAIDLVKSTTAATPVVPGVGGGLLSGLLNG